MVQRFHGSSLRYVNFLFPMDWRNAVSHDLVSQKETDLSINLLEELINQMVKITTLGNVLIIILCSRVSVAVYEKLISKLHRYPQWKLFVEKFRNGGLKGVHVAPALEFALKDPFGAGPICATSFTPNTIAYLLERLLLMRYFSLKKYTAKYTFVGSFTHIYSASTSSTGPSSFNINYILGKIYHLVHNTEDTISWIRSLGIDGTYYPLLILKLVMMLSLICLKLPEHSQILLEFLSCYNSFAYMLPKKFVRNLLRKRTNKNLKLDPEVVVEAFLSINDPLVIVRSGNVSTKVNAPCAIFVDLESSKLEIMGVLFPKKNTHNISMSSNIVNAGTIHEVSSSKTLRVTDMNMNRVELRMNWKVIKEISKAVNTKTGVALNKLSAATIIKYEVEISKGTLATAFANLRSFSDEDLAVACKAIHCLKVLSFAYEKRYQEIRFMKDVKLSVKRLQGHRPKIDDFVKKYFISQESKVGQMVVSVSTYTTEVKEKGDEDSPVELVLKNQCNGDNS